MTSHLFYYKVYLMLRVEHLTKKFGELTALSDVNINVEEGECRGIIGPNGAGKTTLFNVISGFLKPTTGKVFFNGMDVTGFRPYKLVSMGLVRTFQIVRVFKNLTVYQNFQVVLDDPDDLIKEMGLWDRRFYRASDLPFGELRRLSIGLALAMNPRVLLLDEPFSGLSPRESLDLVEVIKGLKEKGVTLVVIEHKLKELFTLADRVTVLSSGKVIFEGSPDEVVNDSRVIEAYLGTG